jgi:uncharacterized protein with LGFP repeats
LGLPTSDEYATPGGRASDFLGGGIYWTPATGAHSVQGLIHRHYVELGGPASLLGYPVSDEYDVPGGRAS